MGLDHFVEVMGLKIFAAVYLTIGIMASATVYAEFSVDPHVSKTKLLFYMAGAILFWPGTYYLN